ncbi:hypothetical protein NDU88_001046 [Pleurodeles waltl]|uniref:Uncharacterized protein n=1 Tax=Pleurodeles waltl TaxID=8319 RepID=A0AAV7VWE9_PLEWA|nr:hypothetical protein NDU88_001046 [Pleurodeles waltl]
MRRAWGTWWHGRCCRHTNPSRPEGTDAGVEPLDGRPQCFFWNYGAGPLAKAVPRKRRVTTGVRRCCRVFVHTLAHTQHEHRVSSDRRGTEGTGAWRRRTVGHRSAFVASVMLCRLLPLLREWWFGSVGNKAQTQY